MPVTSATPAAAEIIRLFGLDPGRVRRAKLTFEAAGDIVFLEATIMPNAEDLSEIRDILTRYELTPKVE